MYNLLMYKSDLWLIRTWVLAYVDLVFSMACFTSFLAVFSSSGEGVGNGDGGVMFLVHSLISIS